MLPGEIVGGALGAVGEHTVEAHLEPAGCLIVESGAEVETLVVVLHVHHTILTQVVDTHRIGGLLATAGDAQAVVGDQRRAQQLTVPVGIRAVSPIVEIAAGIAAAIAVDGVLHVGLIGIVVGLEQHGGIFARAGHLQHVGGLLDTHISIIGDLGRLILAAVLGGDNHHTVGGAHTVDGGCRSIFEHRHVGNVVGIEEVDVVVEHTVHHIERIAAGERAGTTDGHLRTLAGHTAINHVHTGHLSLHGSHGRRRRRGEQVLALDHRDRSGQVLGLSRAITNHDHLVEVLHVVHQLDVHHVLGFQLLGLHSHKREFDGGSVGYVVKHKVAVEVSHRTIGRAHNGHAGTNNGLIDLVNNRSFHCLGLCGNSAHHNQ